MNNNKQEQNKALNLDLLVEKSLYEPLRYEDICDLSVSSRCALIRRILDERRRKGAMDHHGRFTDSSLAMLNQHFNFSADFHEWQRRRRHNLVKVLMRKENRPVLTAYRQWSKISASAKKCALKRAAKLHRDTYVEGVCEKLPYEYVFKEGQITKTKSGLVLVFGSFSGSLNTGRGRITHYTCNEELVRDPCDAHETSHHEVTHLIQLHLAYAFMHKHISKAHPLYDAAAYFCLMEQRGAYIPASMGSSYESQPSEVFAEWEGQGIAKAIESLAL